MTEKKNGVVQICDHEDIKTISKYFIFNGKFEGEYRIYHENDILLIISNFKNGKKEGEYKSYYKNGQLCFIYNYKDDKIEGEYISYWENGDIFQIYNYKNGVINI